MLKSIVGTLLFLSCNHPTHTNTHVLINTNLGDIELELFADKAPQTVTAFLSYVESGFYHKSSFYRVLKFDDQPAETNSGVIQGGIWQTNPQRKIKLMGIPHESTRETGLSHTDGTLSLARTDPGTGTSEFFICIGDQSPLDAGRRGTQDSLGFAAFGRVVKGMNVVRKIQSQPSHGDRFDARINIINIKKL